METHVAETKEKSVERWAIESKKRNKERSKRNISHIPDEEVEAYYSLLTEARTNFSLPTVPAMPLDNSSKEQQSVAAATR